MINKIKITEIKTSNFGLSEKIHYECKFCNKTVAIYPYNRKIYERLSGINEFYCNFCLRNGFNRKDNKNILILSFKPIIGYYYYFKYALETRREMWKSEIISYVDSHIDAGLINPIFKYDPETAYWFIDFKRVGKGRKKARLSEVLRTILNILACFNLKSNIYNLNISKLYKKYDEAIDKFYSQRQRPENKRILIPTLAGCGLYNNTMNKLTIEDTKNFNMRKLKIFD